MIELNITLAFQILAFFILLLILNTLLYKPILRILEERKDEIEGTKRKAEVLEREVQSRIKEYENCLNDARIKAQEERLKIREEGFDKEREILEEARKEASRYLSSAKGRLEEEIKEVFKGLREDSKVISSGIAELLIGRKVG